MSRTSGADGRDAGAGHQASDPGQSAGGDGVRDRRPDQAAVRSRDGTILGGAMVGLRACEVITAVALAVHAELCVLALAETAAVNPSMSESLQRCAEKAAEGMLGISRVTLTSLVHTGAWHRIVRRRSRSRNAAGWTRCASRPVDAGRAPAPARASWPFSSGTCVKQQLVDAGAAGCGGRLGGVHVAALPGVGRGVAAAPPRRRTGRRRARTAPAARWARCRPSTRSSPAARRS